MTDNRKYAETAAKIRVRHENCVACANKGITTEQVIEVIYAWPACETGRGSSGWNVETS